MDERALLLLGILRVQSQHGYQINEFIERNLARVADMKRPTAYALLDRLGQAGYIAVHSEQEGNRPPRKVYAITPAGERLYFELLRRFLADPERQPASGGISLMFLDDLPNEERRALIGERLRHLEALIATYEGAPKHEHGVGVDLAIDQQLHLLRAERDWLNSRLLPSLEQEPEQGK